MSDKKNVDLMQIMSKLLKQEESLKKEPNVVFVKNK